MTMSPAEVTHACVHNVYLTVNTGDGLHRVDLGRTDYPTEVKNPLFKERIPVPCKIEFDYGDNATESCRLLTDRETGRMLNDLAREFRVILQAGIVNEKQRKALEDLLQSKLDILLSSVYDYCVVALPVKDC